MNRRREAVERIKRLLKKELTDSEYTRIEPVIEIILRNRSIRHDFEVLKRNVARKDAIAFLADKYCLAEATIQFIVYRRNIKHWIG